MSTARVQTWIWVLIYLGMVGVGLGLSVQRSDTALGWVLIVPAVVLIAAGIALIWVRSRMKDNQETP